MVLIGVLGIPQRWTFLIGYKWLNYMCFCSVANVSATVWVFHPFSTLFYMLPLAFCCKQNGYFKFFCIYIVLRYRRL